MGGGPGSINFLGRELGLVGGDAPEVGGGARGIPKAVTGQKAKWQRDGNWRSEAAEKILKEAGTQYL